MKKKIILVVFSVGIGILFTFTFLNKENTYAKEKNIVYVFQVGAYEDYDKANKFLNTLPNGIIIKEDNFYKVYIGIYKNIDIVNKMLVYFEDHNIHIYLKSINVSTNFYNYLDKYEILLDKSTDELLYNKINQSILDLYIESKI